MPYARFEKAAQDAAGNLLTDIWCEVRREDVAGNPLQPLFADRLGAVGLSNPFMTPNGVPAFHAAGGAYRVRYYKAGFDETYRYVGVGLGAENDLQGFVPMGAWHAETAYTIGDVVSVGAHLFASKVNDNLNEEPDETPQDSAFWAYMPGLVGPLPVNALLASNNLSDLADPVAARGNLKIVTIEESDYAALDPVDPNTLYFIVADV